MSVTKTQEYEGQAWSETIGSCLGILVMIGISALCVDYALSTTIGVDVPWWADLAAGFLLQRFALPVACIVWLLSFAIDAPFVSVGG